MRQWATTNETTCERASNHEAENVRASARMGENGRASAVAQRAESQSRSLGRADKEIFEREIKAAFRFNFQVKSLDFAKATKTHLRDC